MIRSTASARPPSLHDNPPIAELEPRVPGWVDDALGTDRCRIDVGPDVQATASGSLALLTASVARAREMPARELRREVFLVYRRIESALAVLHRDPIRFWNYIPAIGETMGTGLDRYMVFNAGRYEAFAPAPQRGGKPFVRPLATASAVGVGGTDLVVHCLASDTRGAPVENPRQTSPWRYSARYGPVPPCFSRATVASLGKRTALLIGGTASIVGEQSQHQSDVEAQLQETLRNLGALIGAARQQPESEAGPLGRLTDLRAYVTGNDMASLVRETLVARCPRAARVEVVRARLCRPELLLEIEGVADI